MTSQNTVNPRAAATPPLEEAMARQQTTRVLAECLAKLPEREREAVLLMSEGRSMREIGEQMGFTGQYAHIIVTGAIRKLRNMLRCRGIAATGDLLFGEPTAKRAAVSDGRIAEAA